MGTHKNLIFKCATGILISQAAGTAGAQFTMRGVPLWYATLVKPALTPPNYVFAPVWITLYTLMGIAFGLAWHKGGSSPDTRKALGLFTGQLALNVLWTGVFFGLRSPLPALIVIAILWATVAMTALSFNRLSRGAALLLTPYLAWLGFAAYLNAGVWVLNR